MKRMYKAICMVVMFTASVCLAVDMPGDYNYTGEVNIDTGGKLKLKNTEVTTTAAELNQLDGNGFKSSVTVTGDVTVVNGTNKIVRQTSTVTGFSGAGLADLPKSSFTFMDDFYTVITSTNVTESTALLVPWKYTGDTADSVAKTVGATAGGILTFLTGSTDNNEAYMQYGPLGTEGSFVITSNGAKKVWFEARILAAPQAHEGGFFVGLADPGSSAANFLVDDSGIVDTNKNFMGFWIGTSSSNAYYEFTCNKADAAAAVSDIQIVTNTAATYVRLGFMFDGVRTTTVYADGTAKSRVHTNNAVSYPNAVVMSPIIAIKTGLASTINTGKVDYIRIQQER